MKSEETTAVGGIAASEGRRPAGRARGLWKPLALLAAIVAVLVLAKALGLGKRLGDLDEWIKSLGPWGPVAFILIYIVATVAAVPGTALTLVAGALFGSVLGVVCVSVASTVGATLCFMIARYFARGAVTEWLSGNEKFRRLDELTEQQGWIVVAITRLVPLFPFNLLNYGFGLTRVRLRTYVLFSWTCMLPGTIAFVVGADAFKTAVKEGKVPWVLLGVLVAVVCILVVLVRYARRALKDKESGGRGREVEAQGETADE